MDSPTLFEKLGGASEVQLLVTSFYEKVLADTELAPYFKNTDMVKQNGNFAAFVGQVLGGPDEYEGDNMKEVHSWMGITNAAFSATAKHFDDACWDVGIVKEDIEVIMKAVGSLRGDIVTK
jgi:hemoglobin